MNRKVIKVISILLMILMAVTLLSTSVSAATSWSTIGTSNYDKAEDKSNAAESVQGIVGAILTIVQVIGMGVAIIMLVVMAIKYISAAPSEKAEIKKGVTIYVVGAIVLFAASGILQIVKSFADDNINQTSSGATSYVEMVDVDEMHLG